MINGTALYVLWLRELKRFLRAKERIVGMVIMPLFFLLFFGSGFRKLPIDGLPEGADYLTFLVPGMIGMSMLFTSVGSGVSLLWDKEFGFLKEIMVAPVNRVSIVLGRTLGGLTTTLLQGMLILGASFIVGFRIENLFMLIPALGIMALISMTFIGLGLIFASFMDDMHGFQLVMNMVVMPIFFLSGAFFPIKNLPPPNSLCELRRPINVWCRCTSPRIDRGIRRRVPALP